MPSPFPGMDPFIESQEWSDSHVTFVAIIAELITPGIRPRIERRAYAEQVFASDRLSQWHPNDKGRAKFMTRPLFLF